MNSVFVAFLSFITLFLAYRFYGRYVSRLFNLSADRVTPACQKNDGVDFVPAHNPLVLFGHHFCSIAGAGPIVGPVLAVAYWGWLPALVWLILGVIFIGAVHDFSALIISVRHDGNSIAEVAGVTISRRARMLFLGFVWLSLILVIAIFTILAAQTFTVEPKIVLPSLGLIPIAFLFGALNQKFPASEKLWTLLSLGLFIVLIFGGSAFSVTAGQHSFDLWTAVILIYCAVASVVPVQVLLQPRDYLSSFLLFAGLLIGFIGVFWTHPPLSTPAWVSAAPQGTSFGMLWPMLFVTVACGAVSGFHGLVASGTTSKQIATENHACRIGYGAMLGECALGVLALLAVAAGLGSETVLRGYIFSRNPDAINAFAQGFGAFTPFLGKYGSIFAAMILNAFILTTLDTATRIARYTSHELFAIENRWVATLIPLGIAIAVIYSGAGGKIWPVFGASNQLIAALSLFVASAWLMRCGKNALVTFIPACLMLMTTVAALLYQGWHFFIKGSILLGSICAVLLLLCAVLAYEFIKKYPPIDCRPPS